MVFRAITLLSFPAGQCFWSTPKIEVLVLRSEPPKLSSTAAYSLPQTPARAMVGGTGGVGFQKEELPIGTLRFHWFDMISTTCLLSYDGWLWMLVGSHLGNLQLFGVWTNVEVPSGYNFNQSEQAFAKHGLNHSCLTMCSPVVFVGL